jgi:hypothetical protein
MKALTKAIQITLLFCYLDLNWWSYYHDPSKSSFGVPNSEP